MSGEHWLGLHAAAGHSKYAKYENYVTYANYAKYAKRAKCAKYAKHANDDEWRALVGLHAAAAGHSLRQADGFSLAKDTCVRTPRIPL